MASGAVKTVDRSGDARGMRHWRIPLRSLVCVAVVLAGCTGAAPQDPTPRTAPSASPTDAASATARPTQTATSTGAASPTGAFAAITDDPVPGELAAELQFVLERLAGGAGVSATVMSARGTWSGATGEADGVRDVTIDTQFSIASTTKSVAAAQVMQLVEAGKLGLDDLAAEHLPPDLDFDTNGATIRDLLGHRSGIPDYVEAVGPKFQAEPLRFWTPAELLAEVPADRTPAGEAFAYGNVNYVLLGLVVEDVTGRPFAEVLRDGVLGIDGVDRLIYQPDEVPTEPVAVENGQSADWFKSVGGFLPSYALTSDGPAAAMASDSISLGRWWRALCAGEIVSPATLTAMLPTAGYGLGLYLLDRPGTVGHGGEDLGGVSLAGCVPDDGVVFAVLVNRNVDVSAIAGPLVAALRSP